jgi:hypothetical protein
MSSSVRPLDLWGVWASSGSDVFAVGAEGTALHYDGAVWEKMETGTALDLIGISGLSGTDIWAVGEGGAILHYDGASWTSMESGTTRTLKGVFASPGGVVFAVGANGTVLEYVSSPTGVMTASPRLVLHENAPNPFNVSTSFRFALPRREEVDLSIFDVTGARVARLAGGVFPPGEHLATWDGRDTAGMPARSGVYVCRLKVGGDVITRKVVRVR